MKLADEARILTVFAKRNPVAEEADNAPPVNEVFGTDLPELSSSRAFGIHTAAIEQYPERFEILKTTMAAGVRGPRLCGAGPDRRASRPSSSTTATRRPAMAEAEAIQELAMKYESLLTGDEG